MKLGIFEKFLPPDEKAFCTHFEESAKVCRRAAELFLDIVHTGLTEDKLIEAKRLKHQSNDLAKENLSHLNSTFITPIDREDIQLITVLLNKITKRIIKACVNLRVYRLKEFNNIISEQAVTLVKAADELTFSVELLKKPTLLKEATESNHRMRKIEIHGDEILYMAMDDLFSGKYDAITVIKLRDIYKQVENALDSCFSVSDEVLNIILKHG